MSDEKKPAEASATPQDPNDGKPGVSTDKSPLGNETVRPPDILRDAKNNPSRPGFREKPNARSKAQKSGKKR